MRPDALLLLRLLWAGLPLTVGPAIEAAVAPASTPVRVVVAVGCWVTWAAVLLALLVPRLASLTALRVGAPALATVAAVAAVRDELETADLVAVAMAAIVAVATAWPTVADRLVDGSSYGPERRFPLRVPPAVAGGAAPLGVAVVLGGLVAGPLLLATRQWIAGTVALVLGLPAAALALRSLHALSRRFLVLVPGGIVVHDPFTLTDPVLLARGSLARIGPAPEDSEAVDLTLGAGGLIVELALDRPDDLVLRRPGRGPDEAVRTSGVLVAPTRPGALLTEATTRGLPTR